MKTYKIKLNGEELELSLTFDNLLKVEALVGNVYQLASKIGDSKLGLIDVVNIYYEMQHNSAESQSDLMENVLEDGLTHHLEQVVGLLSGIFTGSKKGKTVKK